MAKPEKYQSKTYKNKDWISSLREYFDENYLGHLIAVVALGLFRFSPSGWLTLGFVILAMFVYQYKKYDSRIPIMYALAMLVATAFVMTFWSNSFANNLAAYSYYFLVMGVVLLVIDYIREGKHEDE